MRSKHRVECRNCRFFRSAPYEARVEGCFLPDNMPAKQKAAYLDEQQIPGDHEKINLRGDCPDFQRRAARQAWWRRVLSLGA